MTADMASSALPILYSFRRCPYAIRARMALYARGINVELREVWLREKPAPMLAISPKGTVPVLQLPDGQVLEESWDIMLWATAQYDPKDWRGQNDCWLTDSTELVSLNDGSFKPHLDGYKYPDSRAHPAEYYRKQAQPFLESLEKRLTDNPYLLDEQCRLADVAIFPFIRQFAAVDKDWFAQSPYPKLKDWLDRFVTGELFHSIMKKYPAWKPGDTPTWL